MSILANRKVRFAIVGAANTLFNFVILNLAFYALHKSKIIASIIATCCAVALSFFLNRGFVFKHKQRSLRQPILFVIVTLLGVLLVQNSVYALCTVLLRDHTTGLINLIHDITRIRFSSSFIDINLSNLVGSLFAMFWNYNGYRMFVFTNHTIPDEIVEIPA